jgi:hypothetical protein
MSDTEVVVKPKSLGICPDSGKARDIGMGHSAWYLLLFQEIHYAAWRHVLVSVLPIKRKLVS